MPPTSSLEATVSMRPSRCTREIAACSNTGSRMPAICTIFCHVCSRLSWACSCARDVGEGLSQLCVSFGGVHHRPTSPSPWHDSDSLGADQPPDKCSSRACRGPDEGQFEGGRRACGDRRSCGAPHRRCGAVRLAAAAADAAGRAVRLGRRCARRCRGRRWGTGRRWPGRPDSVQQVMASHEGRVDVAGAGPGRPDGRLAVRVPARYRRGDGRGRRPTCRPPGSRR